jgi:hypothetical protein
MKTLALSLLIALSICAPAHADNDNKPNKGEPKDHGNATAPAPAHVVPLSSPAPVNHGQVVSDCNHRANDRALKGQERQDWVEWCTSRGYRYTTQNGPKYWDSDRSCYSRANDHGLSGDRREDFLRSCLGKDDDRVVDDRYRNDEKCQPGEPRGKDVLGKSCD